ncbi:hypothetical protein OROGR_031859 [Orobanche gracilis]
MPTTLSTLHPIFRPIFSGVFHHKLKHHLIGLQRFQIRPILSRGQAYSIIPFVTSSFSTRSGRGRMGSGSGQNVRAGSSKSLIDDEADLSDWVKSLDSSSLMKTGVFSDSENDENDKDGGFRGREGAVKRRRESEFDKSSDFMGRRGGGARRSNETFSGTGRRGENNDSNGNMFGGRGKGLDSSKYRKNEKFKGLSQESGGFSSRGNERSRENMQRENNDSNSNLIGWRDKGCGSGGFTRNGKFKDIYQEKRESGSGFLSRGNERSRANRHSDKTFKVGNGRDRSDDKSGFAMRPEKETGRRGILKTGEEGMVEEKKGTGYMSFKELIDSDEDEDEDEDEVKAEGKDEDLGGNEVVNKKKSFAHLTQGSPGGSDSHLSESRFDQCPISPMSLKAIKDAGYERMTLVQEATLPVILKGLSNIYTHTHEFAKGMPQRHALRKNTSPLKAKRVPVVPSLTYGKDVLAKAKTGTGKTVAFLLPAIELVVKSPPVGRDEKRPPISVLVICPTRELASQAASEANTLLKYHPSIGVQVVIGGTRLALEQKRMQANLCQILVATPGRLKDHIENTSGFATRLMGVKVLVLDEADQLLDMGFRSAIENIISAVPKQRQTLLFSATVPQEVRQICHIALKRDHEFINTVQEGSEDTHAQVRQMHLVAPLDKHFSLLFTMLKDHIADDVNYKVLVFCTTAMVTRLVAGLLGELNLNVREIHSRKPQSYRTRISDEFRKSKGLILVTSDVSARGVDYPDVTLVIQIGVPADRQQYIHRLGRTGRKGKEGQGILMLAPWEEYFLSSIKDLPISKAPQPLVDPDTRKKVERALSQVEMKNKESAYQAWLGYYNSNRNVGRDKCRLVELANEFSRSMGLDNPPAIPKLVLGKMGLKNIPGLRSK